MNNCAKRFCIGWNQHAGWAWLEKMESLLPMLCEPDSPARLESEVIPDDGEPQESGKRIKLIRQLRRLTFTRPYRRTMS